ncbi:MRG/MORF4L-binding protein-like [Scleropages formosus]|uniref:MRG/MORF4L-binding protein-like n=1 Tax=Scleropages formosus TaxID=113540 RepID=A0A0P7TWV1_SCLFO|nr:MRG/MORF4L-binding protein-like [Scleropages formosus]
MGEAEAVQTDEKHSDSAISPTEDSVVWSQEVEVCLFHAMLGHKPVGVNRHFHMICIRDKFSQNIGRQVSSKVIWDHLGTMYDMQALHESEILPFPNSEKAFVLPEEIIQEVKEGLGPSLAGQEFESEAEIWSCTESGSQLPLTVDPLHLSLAGSSSVKTTEKGSSKDKEKDKERGSSESSAKEAADKRKRNRVTEKVLSSSSNPSSPGGAKRRRT